MSSESPAVAHGREVNHGGSVHHRREVEVALRHLHVAAVQEGPYPSLQGLTRL